MKRFACVTMVAGALMLAGAAEAQIYTPTYQSPRLTNDLGIYANSGPGDWGIEGIWRGGPLGLRVGYVDLSDGLISLGVELRSPLQVQGAPLGLAFTGSAQGLVGDDSAFGVQGGLSAGYTFMGQGLAFTPYINPRIALVQDLGPSDDLDVRLLADIGADIEFANNLIFRVGGGLGTHGAEAGFGIAIRR